VRRIVNPDGLRNQVEGAVVQGLGGALFEARPIVPIGPDLA
jgi:CO/xanthine dehydrogenase Mo-binding subunit